jgi:GT2 family glycosyltransferase
MDTEYSIIVPTCNNADLLSSCLTSIVESSQGENYQIIVVDNGSTDDTASICDDMKSILGEHLIYVPLPENRGFCAATNRGMELSSGRYIVWLNDDTIVTPHWLPLLKKHLCVPHLYHPNIGLVGPRSNNVAGAQRLGEPAIRSPKDIALAIATVTKNEGSERLFEDNQGNVLSSARLTIFLSGFCLMMKREVFETVGLIDERFSPGGYCDNDYLVRAFRSGFGAVISDDTFVFHHGSATINRDFPELKGGVRNWSAYIQKYRSAAPQTVLLIQRIKIDSDSQLRVFSHCAQRNAPLVDGLLILSDRSSHPEFSEQLCREIFGEKLIDFSINTAATPFNEIRDRLMIMTKAHESSYDWVIMLDHDECFGKHTDRSRLDQLMNPLDPSLLGYSFLFNNYWRGYEFARVDGPWGMAAFPRMWRNKLVPPSLRPLRSAEDKGLHTGNRPLGLPANGFKMCDIVIDHLGYADNEEAERKHAFYNAIDDAPRNIQEHSVGSINYHHLINEVGIKVVVPKEFSLSVNMMVKNEEANIGMQLLNYAPIVREFIIADTGSTDRTMEYLDAVGIPYLQIPFEDDFSKIRNALIKKSRSMYIMQVDADEIPGPDYLHKIVAMLNVQPDLCLAHLHTPRRDGRIQTSVHPRIFKNDPRFYFSGRVHETLDQSLEKLEQITRQDLHLEITNSGHSGSESALRDKLLFYGRLLQREIEDNPHNAKALFELAVHYRNFGRTAEAIELLQRAIESRPSFVRSHIELSLIHVNFAIELIESCQGLLVEHELALNLERIRTSLLPWRHVPVK